MWPKEKMLPQGENGLREKTFPEDKWDQKEYEIREKMCP